MSFRVLRSREVSINTTWSYYIMNENKSKHEVDVKQIIDMLLKRWWIIVITVAVAVAGAFAYTYFMVTPTYTSSATMLINGGNNMTSYQQILAGQYQLVDYPFILKSHDTLQKAANLLNADESVNYRETYTSSVLYGMVSYQSVEDSRIFKIVVTSTSPEEAQAVANVIKDVFEDETERVISGTVVQLVETPRLPTSASSSGLKKTVVVGAAVGAVLGAVIAVLLGLGSDVLDSEEWLLKTFKNEAPLLTIIPDASTSFGGRYYYRYKYKRYYKYSSKSQKEKDSK